VKANDADASRTVQAYMVLAMAQFQLKQADQARATLADGVKLAAKSMPKMDGLNWNDQMTAYLLMREAKQFIGEAPDAVAK